MLKVMPNKGSKFKLENRDDDDLIFIDTDKDDECLTLSLKDASDLILQLRAIVDLYY
jgi:hypothetical protein